MLINDKSEFTQLFGEFINSYPYTPNGISHIKSYTEQRQQACRNFEIIRTAADRGDNITELVLLKLLPHSNTINNRQRGAWIHIAPPVTKDIKELFEGANLAKSDDWNQIASAIFNFVRSCNAKPKELLNYCMLFAQLHCSKGFQMDMLTPILNALQPNKFLLINNTSQKVINYFANTNYENKLTDYPKLNDTGRNLIQELAQDMHQVGVPALRDDDLFDMFCHWLIAIKKYDFQYRHQQNITKVDTNIKYNPKYTLFDISKEIGFEETKLEFWTHAINRKKQAIFYGSPGTGKSFMAEKLAQHLTSEGDGFYELVQFHPAYTYEDFIQGIRPQSEDGKLTYPLVPGRFLEFCKKAEICQDTCVLIIDEINRANLPQVFGELMYLLEYRDQEIPLAGGNRFRIPENVRIIGTMNTADRSIAQIDHALRRRFAFIELRPNYDVLIKYHFNTGFAVMDLIDVLKRLNHAIDDKNYEIGISFFLTSNLREDIENIWRMEIEPYLEEYFFNNLGKVDEFRWDNIKEYLTI
ncbi:McrB family protein [Anabaena azotica]|uniref:McrB family protein n=1 Tax=Anabaena azotica TaxID=197653 RepID=UPI0039A60578